MIVFGGKGDRDICFNETYILNLKTVTWTRKLTMHTPPSLHFHNACVLNCVPPSSGEKSGASPSVHMIVFGGGTPNKGENTSSSAARTRAATISSARTNSFLGVAKFSRAQRSPLQTRHSPSKFVQLAEEVEPSSALYVLDLGMSHHPCVSQ